jgi:hypothetical protein
MLLMIASALLKALAATLIAPDTKVSGKMWTGDCSLSSIGSPEAEAA